MRSFWALLWALAPVAAWAATDQATSAFLEATSLLQQGQREAALDLLLPLQDDELPDGLWAHAAFHRGELLLNQLASAGSAADRQALAARARAELSRVPADGRYGLQARLLIIQSLLTGGDLEAAQRLADEAAERYTQTAGEPAAQLMLARCQEHQAARIAREGSGAEARQRLRQAATIYQEVVALWPDQPTAERARARLSELATRRIYPGAPRVDFLLRKTRAIASRLTARRALRALTRIRSLLPASSKDPARAVLDLWYADLAGRLRWFGTAAATLQRLKASAPLPELKAHAGLMHAGLLSRRSLEAALEAFQAVRTTYPDSEAAAAACVRSGELLSRAGRLEAARGTFLACLAHSRKGAFTLRVLWGIGWSAFRLGDLDIAFWWLDFMLSPDNTSGASTEEEEATPSFALPPGGGVEPPDALLERARYWRARIRELRGEAGAARREFAEVTRLRPTSYYAALARERLLSIGALVAPPLSPGVEPAAPTVGELGPDVAAPWSYYRLGRIAEARAALAGLRIDRLSGEDRRAASLLWLTLGDFTRSFVTSGFAWDGGNGRGGREDDPVLIAVDARLAFPRAFADQVEQARPAPSAPAALLYALMRAESAFNPKARSPAGALGLTQVIPKTAYQTAAKLKLKGFAFWKLQDPAVSILVGGAHLGELLLRFGQNIALTLAAYNAGERAVLRWLGKNGTLPLDAFIEEIPYEETRRYVKKVLCFYAMYRLLYEPDADQKLGLDLEIAPKLLEEARRQAVVNPPKVAYKVLP